MSRLYTVVFADVAVTAAQDLFELTPADDKPVSIVGLFLAQSSDFGDSEEEGLRYSVIRGHTTGGSGGTAPTPAPVKRTDPAAGFAAEVNNTTIASAGTTETLHTDVFLNRVGEKLWLPDGFGWEASQGDTTIVVRLHDAPADELTMSGTLYVEEQG